MVPLLEPPLLLERGWEEADDRESTGPVGGLGVGDGDGVRVGDVLLEVEEFPDWGLFFNSIFCKGVSMNSSAVSLNCFGRLNTDPYWVDVRQADLRLLWQRQRAERFLRRLDLHVHQTCCSLPLSRDLGKNTICATPWWRKEDESVGAVLKLTLLRLYICVNLNGYESPGWVLLRHWSHQKSGASGSGPS